MILGRDGVEKAVLGQGTASVTIYPAQQDSNGDP